MSDGTANYVNKEYGYAKLFWDFQKLDVPMRHLRGQGDKSDWNGEETMRGVWTQCYIGWHVGTGTWLVPQWGSVSSLKSALQN